MCKIRSHLEKNRSIDKSFWVYRVNPPELHSFIKKWAREQDGDDDNAKLSEYSVVIPDKEIQIVKKHTFTDFILKYKSAIPRKLSVLCATV